MTATLTTGTLTAPVHSCDLSTGHGPGTRFVVYLAGCPLSCRYCHSPRLRSPASGTHRSVDELIGDVRPHKRALRRRGGLTVSGGEPLLRPAFTTALLRAAREEGLHTALDTAGTWGTHAPDELLDATDLVLLDVKSWHPDTYRYVTGGGEVTPTLGFARRLAERGVPMWIRFVVVPDLTDAPSNVDGVARFAALLSTVERVEVVPFRRSAARHPGPADPAPLPDPPEPDEALVQRVREQFAGHGLSVH